MWSMMASPAPSHSRGRERVPAARGSTAPATVNTTVMAPRRRPVAQAVDGRFAGRQAGPNRALEDRGDRQQLRSFAVGPGCSSLSGTRPTSSSSVADQTWWTPRPLGGAGAAGRLSQKSASSDSTAPTMRRTLGSGRRTVMHRRSRQNRAWHRRQGRRAAVGARQTRRGRCPAAGDATARRGHVEVTPDAGDDADVVGSESGNRAVAESLTADRTLLEGDPADSSSPRRRERSGARRPARCGEEPRAQIRAGQRTLGYQAIPRLGEGTELGDRSCDDAARSFTGDAGTAHGVTTPIISHKYTSMGKASSRVSRRSTRS